MIKNFSNIAEKNKGEQYKQIAHLITNLYKIKTIDRKVIYTLQELRQLVLDSEIGKQVIVDMKELGVSQMILIDYDFIFFNSVLGNQFPEY